MSKTNTLPLEESTENQETGTEPKPKDVEVKKQSNEVVELDSEFVCFGTAKQQCDLWMAIAKAQGDFGAVSKDAENPFFHSKYATLAAILRQVIPVVSKAGIAVMQFPTTKTGGLVSVKTVIAHKGGGRVSSTCTGKVKNETNVMQAIGSAISYIRRYQIQSIFCICMDTDDDANGTGRVK